MKFFDKKLGFIDIPNVFTFMKSDDAKFEYVKSFLALPLRIYRKDILVGHRLMLYIKDQNYNK